MNNTGGSRTDGLLKITLFFFVALFAFSVGTYVGKRVSEYDRLRMANDLEYKSELEQAGVSTDSANTISDADIDQLSKEFIQAESNEASSDKSKVAKKVDADEAKKAEEDGFVKLDRKTASKDSEAEPMKSAKASAEKAPVAKKAAPTRAAANDLVKKAADRVAKDKAPLATPPIHRDLARVLPKISPNSIGKYTVQVASYATEKEAQNHAKSLKDIGYSAFYLSAKVKSRVWYRVSVGLYDSKAAANNMKRELLKSANLKSAIIQKIIK